jgi:2OG-Fe(II) oxygenase superfamily
MSSIGATLLKRLESVERPGDFCTGGLRTIFMPSIDVLGVGRIALPLLPAQAKALVAIAEAAPYGRGADTIVDSSVRRTWQIDPGKVEIGGRQWDKTLADLVADVASGLGVTEPIAADFYKLLIYDAGSFFLGHRDTEKVPGMFATLVIVLPSEHEGGDLIVRHLGREVTFDQHPRDPSDIAFAAFYADCVHEVRPVASGYRATLVYNLRLTGSRLVPNAPDYRTEQDRVAELLRRWADAEDEPDKLILPLEHAYTPAELSFGSLKGADAGIASVLVKAAAAADCDLHLVLVSIEESGSAYATGGGYRRRRWDRNDDDDGDDGEFEVIDVDERALILSEWRRPDGSAAEFSNFPFEEEELCPPDAFDDLTPDEQHFHEASGNEGASFERTYRRAGLVLWPHVRRLAVLNQAGLGATLPYLDDLTARWEASGASAESPLWREADTLSEHMLRSWPEQNWGRSGSDTEAMRMLELQARLGSTERIEAFLAEQSAQGNYSAQDNEAIVRAAALLPPARATDLLVRIVGRNTVGRVGACSGLVLLCVSAPSGAVGDAAKLGAALLGGIPGDPVRFAGLETWQRPAPPKPDAVVDLLSAVSLIDAGLAMRTVEYLLTWPKTYDLDTVLVPTALSFATRPESLAWPAVTRLRNACLDHLGARIALELEAPRDWRRPNPLTCGCEDCRDLGAFLIDPSQKQWRLRAIQHRRTHVEGSVRMVACDADLTTEKRGSPHTLIATKNQASYERRVKQRRQDLDHVAALAP